MVKSLRSEKRNELIYKEAKSKVHVYDKAIVKYKAEIVSIGARDAKRAVPLERIGKYVEPKDWDSKVVHDPDTIILDVRNDYEVQMGSFKRAINPKTETFNDFTKFVRQELPKKVTKNSKVAMFCTGGVRCEKASALLLAEGYKDVYHLKGGILQYLEDVPEKDSTYQGECYVFDKRISVDHNLKQGSYDQCIACEKYIRVESLQDNKCCKQCSESPQVRKLLEKRRRDAKSLERWVQLQAKRNKDKKKMGDISTRVAFVCLCFAFVARAIINRAR